MLTKEENHVPEIDTGSEHKLSEEEINSLTDKILSLDPDSLKEVLDFILSHQQ